MNPYLVLGVPRDATDQTIRRTYLEAIKVATPESAPERFKALAEAYDRIKDETRRLHYEVSNTECPGDSPLDVLLCCARAGHRPPPLPFEAMRDFLRSCAKS